MLGSAATALAAPNGIQVQPWVYDPDGLGISQAAWVTGEGEPDAGASNHALYLTKSGATAENAASGATINGVDGMTVTELGFDYRDDGHCGAGAPRFNVYAADGSLYGFFGCAAASQSDLGNGWTRARISLPGVQVSGIEIVFDEGTDVGTGFVYLDNIDVNGILAGKPGLAK